MKINIELYSDLDLALMVTSGLLGNGADRRANLGARYLPVQLLVNRIARGDMPKPVITPKPYEIDKEHVKKVLTEMQPTVEEYQNFVNEVIEKLYDKRRIAIDDQGGI